MNYERRINIPIFANKLSVTAQAQASHKGFHVERSQSSRVEHVLRARPPLIPTVIAQHLAKTRTYFLKSSSVMEEQILILDTKKLVATSKPSQIQLSSLIREPVETDGLTLLLLAWACLRDVSDLLLK